MCVGIFWHSSSVIWRRTSTFFPPSQFFSSAVAISNIFASSISRHIEPTIHWVSTCEGTFFTVTFVTLCPR
uniref:Uncharacterized protein n=1 Tax=Octopus bimaculoides TaxID=37653 RepID=A0A0L8GZM2_OCTBM